MTKPHAPGVMGIMAASLAEQRAKATQDTQGRLERVFDDDDDFEPATASASVVSIASEPPAAVEAPAVGAKGAEKIIAIDPNLIVPWDLADRPLDEIGDLESLTESIRIHGQETAALVRPAKTKGRYELIYGHRRWMVCRDLGIKLRCVVREMDDKTAHKKMVLENSDREAISSWARALNFKKAIDNGLYPSESALAASLGIHRSSLNNIMAFTRIPADVAQAIGPMSKVGVQTAKAIVMLCKSEEQREFVIKNAEKIATGTMTGDSLISACNRAQKPRERETKVVTDDSGRKLFSMRQTGRGMTEVMFYPEALRRFTEEEMINKIKGLF